MAALDFGGVRKSEFDRVKDAKERCNGDDYALEDMLCARKPYGPRKPLSLERFLCFGLELGARVACVALSDGETETSLLFSFWPTAIQVAYPGCTCAADTRFSEERDSNISIEVSFQPILLNKFLTWGM